MTEVPVSGSQDDVLPEVRTEHGLEEVEHVPESSAQSVVVLLEQDDEDVDVAEVVLKSIHHRLHMEPLISIEKDDITKSVMCMTFHLMSSPKPGVSMTVMLEWEEFPKK